MNDGTLARRIDAMSSRLAQLAGDRSTQGSHALVAEAVADLSTAMEELRVAEEELRQQNEELLAARQSVDEERRRYQELFDFAPEAYLATNFRGRITEANHAASRLLNMPGDFLVGKPLASLVSLPDRRAYRALIARLQQSDEATHSEVRLTPRLREPIDAAVKVGATRDADGRAVAIRWVLRDVTRERRAEETIRVLNKDLEQRVEERTRQLAAANQAKDRFLAALSHELRTPLTPALLSVARLETDDGLPESVRETARMIRRNIDLETRLIDDLLDLTRVAHGKLRLAIQDVDVHRLLRDVLVICGQELEAKQLLVRDELASPRYHLRGDPSRLQQVFWNLLRNAIKFTPPAGSITIRSSLVEPSSDAQARIRLDVSDTGVGIEPEVMARIFEAFEQGSPDGTFGGLGLGLSISKALVEAHGGRLSVASEGLGRGAAFSIQLDLAADEAPKSPGVEQPPSSSAARPLRILLVEDHADTAFTISQLLRHVGHDVVLAQSIAGALERAESEPFDLLISDLGLPDGNGRELMSKLRERTGIQGIAYSGYGTQDDIRQSCEAGFARHLTKPVTLDQILDAIGQLGPMPARSR